MNKFVIGLFSVSLILWGMSLSAQRIGRAWTAEGEVMPDSGRIYFKWEFRNGKEREVPYLEYEDRAYNMEGKLVERDFERVQIDPEFRGTKLRVFYEIEMHNGRIYIVPMVYDEDQWKKIGTPKTSFVPVPTETPVKTGTHIRRRVWDPQKNAYVWKWVYVEPDEGRGQQIEDYRPTQPGEQKGSGWNGGGGKGIIQFFWGGKKEEKEDAPSQTEEKTYRSVHRKVINPETGKLEWKVEKVEAEEFEKEGEIVRERNGPVKYFWRGKE